MHPDNDKFEVKVTEDAAHVAAKSRPIGLAQGQFEVTAAFFAPLPESFLRAFETSIE